MLTTTPHPHIHIVSFPLLHRPKAPNSSFIEHVEDNANHFTSPPSATVSADRFGLYNQPDHSHEPSSDSELVKRLKGLIKVRNSFIFHSFNVLPFLCVNGVVFGVMCGHCHFHQI